jgi:hypothetical protein
MIALRARGVLRRGTYEGHVMVDNDSNRVLMNRRALIKVGGVGLAATAALVLGADPAMARTGLTPGQSLRNGARLTSPDGRYSLIMQSDGNLVIYGPGGAQWATSTNGPGRWAVMQSDGNLVVYGPSGPLWASNTGDQPGAHLVMQSDGNLVIYRGSVPVFERYAGRLVGLKPKVDKFAAARNGQFADFDGQYGAQCVDLANFYTRDVLGFGTIPCMYAYQMWDNAPSARYARVPAVQPAQVGDLAVFGTALAYGAGHVAIVRTQMDLNTLQLFQQNAPLGSACVTGTLAKTHLSGFLRPKV